MRDEPTGSASIDLHVPPEAVWDLIADIERMREWSPETTAAHWIAGATTARPGPRFKRHEHATPVVDDDVHDHRSRPAVGLAFSVRRGETTWCYA